VDTERRLSSVGSDNHADDVFYLDPAWNESWHLQF